MPNYTALLNEEIARIARKEVKSVVDPLSAKVIEQKKKISTQAKEIADLEKRLDLLEDLLGFEEILDSSGVSGEEIKKARITPKYISSLRAKHELSRNEMALLLDINPNSIYLWESGRAKPRNDAKAKLITMKQMGKRELKQLLDEIFI